MRLLACPKPARAVFGQLVQNVPIVPAVEWASTHASYRCPRHPSYSDGPSLPFRFRNSRCIVWPHTDLNRRSTWNHNARLTGLTDVMSKRPCYLEFDEKRLRDLIRYSSPRSPFWKLLKAELTLGRWKRLSRGRTRRMAKQS